MSGVEHTFASRENDTYGDVAAALKPSDRFEFFSAAHGHAIIDHLAPTRFMLSEAVIAHRPYQIPSALRPMAQAFLEQRLVGRKVFNGAVVGLGTDLEPTIPERLNLHTAGYFDHLATDVASNFDVILSTGPRESYGRDTFIRAGRPRDFGENGLANAIGVSVLAITADDLLVITRQSMQNQSSGGLLAPSGSGSLEPQDAGEGSENFEQLCLRGALRELFEETGLDTAHVSQTRCLGFARWLEKGGKPEIIYLADLNLTASQVMERTLETEEGNYSDGLLTLNLVNAKSQARLALPLALGLHLMG